MRAKLISLQGTIEAEGAPEELAKFFREYAGLNWSLTGSVTSSGTLGPIQLTPAPVSVPSAWGVPDTCPMSADGQHKWPALWLSVSPAPCELCGRASGPVLPFISAFSVEDIPGTLALPIATATNTCASASGVGSA